MGKVLNIIIIVAVVLLTAIGALSTLITDFLWFEALDLSSIFLTILQSKLVLFLIGFFAFFIFAMINILIAKRFERKSAVSFPLALGISSVIAFIVGMATSDAWFIVQQYLNRTLFNIVDPILGKDVAFYMFSLPFYNVLWLLAFSIIAVTTIMVGLYYAQQFIKNIFTQNVDPHTGMKSVNVLQDLPKLKKSAKNHLSVLFAGIFVLIAVRYYLARYSVMYSREGIVVGAGYVDVNVFLPVVKILMVVAIAVAIAFLAYIFFVSKSKQVKRRHVVFYMLGIYLIFAFIGQGLAPALVQGLRVDPNEFNLERPFIENNIEFTRKAYQLNDIEESDFEANYDITQDAIQRNPETIDNIRILDYRPLTQTYKQTQEIRLYYDLSSIDTDRYMIDGKYRQVMLAPRELNQRQIVDNAKTWVNLHLVYTHGFGLVMSPVNTVTAEGLPDYLVKDIPPTYAVDEPSIRIDQPRIYYGNQDNEYVLVNTLTEEFDYPKGNTNEYINYDGDGGVPLNSFVKKLLFTLRFGDIRLLLTGDITDESKIMFKRNIQERITTVAPFLRLDRDPYIVIADGQMYWIQDAYTTSGAFPYSEKIQNDINYIRNSVKIVVDAYDGTMQFYVMDKEPLIETYRKIFPALFVDASEMPQIIKDHIRYPEDLFQIQSMIFSTYHMLDTNVFYNKEDAWQLPKEIYGTGQQITMEPYYMIMKLPEQDVPEYILMLPFTPLRKDNMIAWLAGRSDGEDYGKLLLYRFPKDKLVYGPSQIEARIDQDSEISQQLTLWSQQGSRVTRGNLLVIPIEDSILYVEPLYIQSEQGQLPELKRVIVSDGDKVVMEQTLEQSLAALFGEVPQEPSGNQNESGDTVSLVNQYYQNILDAMQNNDWESFGDNFDKLGNAIENLE
jgi:uncharacterized membrane protein (UPF0182 family)